MRLIETYKDLQKGKLFSDFLSRKGIANEFEIVINRDWGSAEYGDQEARIWIFEEDQVDDALRWLEFYQTHPNDPQFSAPPRKHLIPIMFESSESKLKEDEEKRETLKKRIPWEQQPMGLITRWILILCTTLFILSQMTTPVYDIIPENIPLTPVFTSPVKKALMYDYPKAYQIIDQILQEYGIQKLANPNTLPQSGQELLKKFYNTPYWQGFYYIGLDYLNGDPIEDNLSAPMFEKIHQGEVWRLFTPCLLHADIFHIFFNMIWLIVLGKMIEQRMSKSRYLLFILLTGIISNTAQYLMSGSNFIGFSGVLVAMLAFIWVRQRKAPWEGYMLQPITITFMAFFILGMFAVQVFSFFSEVYFDKTVTGGIANTAHLSGGIAGLIFGRLNFFSWKKS